MVYFLEWEYEPIICDGCDAKTLGGRECALRRHNHRLDLSANLDFDAPIFDISVEFSRIVLTFGLLALIFWTLVTH